MPNDCTAQGRKPRSDEQLRNGSGPLTLGKSPVAEHCSEPADAGTFPGAEKLPIAKFPFFPSRVVGGRDSISPDPATLGIRWWISEAARLGSRGLLERECRQSGANPTEWRTGALERLFATLTLLSQVAVKLTLQVVLQVDQFLRGLAVPQDRLLILQRQAAVRPVVP